MTDKSFSLVGKSVLVSGGAGFIGSHLVDLLLDRDCKVTVLDDLSTGSLENIKAHISNDRFRLLQGSILDGKLVSQATQGHQVVFHLACLGVRHSIHSPKENFDVNGNGALNMLGAAHKNGVQRFLYCSSSEVYGNALTAAIDENHPTFPHTIYGASKLAGEACARAYHRTYHLPVTIARPFNTFGPRSHFEGDSGELIPKSIIRAITGQTLLIFGSGSQSRDFCYVTDTAEALITLAEAPAAVGGTFNISSKREFSVEKVVSMINSIVSNGNSTIEKISWRPGDVMRLHADTNSLKQVTNWEPKVDFKFGLDQTIKYFRSLPLDIEQLKRLEKGINWSK